MKKILLIICVFCLCGCSNYVEINDLAIITGIILDYEDDEYKLTTELIMNEKKNDVKVYTTKGKTIEIALARISKMTSKELFISDLKNLILTNNILDKNINYYDYFLRNAKTKTDFKVYYVDSDDVSKIYDIEDEVMSFHLDELSKFNKSVYSSSITVPFINLVQTLLEYGKNPVYPSITIKKNSGKDTLYLNNLVSYNTENKKIEFTEEESKFYNLVMNNSNDEIIEIKCGDDYFTIEVENSKSKYDFNNNKFTIDLNITSKMYTYHCKDELNDNTIVKLNKLSTNHIKNSVQDLVKTAKENNNDFLGVGNYIYKRNTKYFDFKNESWDNYLKNLDIEVKSNVNIVSKGEAYNSVGGTHGKNK